MGTVLIVSFSSVRFVTNVQIGSETDDIISLGHGPDQWSQIHRNISVISKILIKIGTQWT